MTYANWREHFAAYCKTFGFANDDAVLARYADVPTWRAWHGTRRAVACEQVTYRWTGIDVGGIDGQVGPLTTGAREAWAHWNATGELPNWRDGDPSWADKPILPTKRDWPTQAQCPAFYGQPGTVAIERELVYVDAPWPLRLAWDTGTTVSRVRCHRKVADALGEVLAAVLATYGHAEIKRLRLDLFGGSYNPRRMVGGTAWSMHAYGCAFDFDPSRNALRTKAPAAGLSAAEYAPWWEAWEAAGATSLGRARNFDWMHVQFADLA